MKSPQHSPRQKRVSHKTKTILCLVCHARNHPIEAKISDGLHQAVTERGYHAVGGVIPIDPRNEVRRLVAQYEGGEIAGIALQPYRPNRELAELLLTPPIKSIPHIIIGHYYDNVQINSCVVDNYGGMYAMTEHIIRCGRKRPAFIGEISLSSTEHERFQGFALACLHQGIQVPPHFIIKQIFEVDLKKELEKLFASPAAPDALVCLFDGLACRVLRILKDLGIEVPRDVVVVSFGDDEDLADTCQPPLSTVHHPAKEMGEVAAHQLINQIEGRIPFSPSVFVLPVGLHIRQSSGTPLDLLPDGKTFWSIPFSNYIGVCTTLEDSIR